jgi:hypothetical protein
MIVIFINTTQTFRVYNNHIYRLTIWIKSG